jgi:hypothetical protein
MLDIIPMDLIKGMIPRWLVAHSLGRRRGCIGLMWLWWVLLVLFGVLA